MRLITGVSALQHLLFRENQLANPSQLVKESQHGKGRHDNIFYCTNMLLNGGS